MNSNWSYGPETAKWGHDLCDLDLWPLTLTFCMDIMSVDGNNSWKFQDDTMTGTLSTRHSENDNTPQPLDQWKNSPLIGQQVGNCKFHIDPLLARSICHVPWPKVDPIVHPTSYPTHIPFIPSESTLPFLSYSNFNILPWKSKVKVMGEVKVWSHNVSLTVYRLTSLLFHVNQPSHSWDRTFSKYDLENPRSRS